MRPAPILIALLFCLSLWTTGCIRRTVTEEPKYANPKTKNQYGGNHTKHLGTEIIWFWQDEFRNP